MTGQVVLLTDFGLEDLYVGVMKGVMRRIMPTVTFVDITHSISPQSVREAALTLMNTYHYFAEDTVFLVVVDPGVGTQRRPIALKAGGYYFVAPDNGVLSYVMRGIDTYEAYELNKSDYWLDDISNTFHGRDIFAPISAHLANNTSIALLGDPLAQIAQLPPPDLSIEKDKINGEVIHIDRFGNIVTSIGQIEIISPERLTLSPLFDSNSESVPIVPSKAIIKIHGKTIHTINRAYDEVQRGQTVALIGSSNFLEISVNQGNAAKRLDVAIGDRVELLIHA